LARWANGFFEGLSKSPFLLRRLVEAAHRASISSTRREPNMTNLAVITAIVARNRVAEQFAAPAVTAAAARAPRYAARI
jgi:hypothetical protein